jgi:SAM-dependent methyltransferase
MRPRYPEQRIVECPDCRLVFFDGSAPAGLYEQKYFAGDEYFDYAAEKAVRQSNFRRELPLLRSLAPAGRLLDIGCAYGFFLELARPYWQAKGIDVSAVAVKYAREVCGVEAVCAEFLELPDENESYDLVCLWDTIEHLPHPVRTIEKAARWLKPGGALVATTADIGSVVARLRRERWRQIHPPTHLYYFSRETLSRALEQAGLRVEGVSRPGVVRSFRAMVYGALAPNKRGTSWLSTLATLGGRLDFPVYLNLYDLLRMVAVKPGHAPEAGPG